MGGRFGSFKLYYCLSNGLSTIELQKWNDHRYQRSLNNSATETYAGSGGTGFKCAKVMYALGYAWMEPTDENAYYTPISNTGVGCVVESEGIGNPYRDTTTTTAGAVSSNWQHMRACACNN